MTIASATSRISYTGDGVTTAFPVPFYFAANADLVVYIRDTGGNSVLQLLGTNYTLSGAGVSAGGTLTFVTAPTTAYSITIYRDPPLTQTASYNNNDPFPAKSHENALDKAVTIDQRTRDLGVRALHLDDSDATATMTLPTLEIRKGKVLAFDITTGAAIPSVSKSADIDSVVSAALSISRGLNTPQVVATIAALKAVSPFSGAVMLLEGSASINDGLTDHFYWNASSVLADDGVMVIQPNAGGTGRWIRLGYQLPAQTKNTSAGAAGNATVAAPYISKMNTFRDLADFGVKYDWDQVAYDGTDYTSQVQNAISDVRGFLRVSGLVKVNGTLNIPGDMIVEGIGRGISGFVFKTGFSASSNGLVISSGGLNPYDGGRRGRGLSNFGIFAQSGTVGLYPITIDLMDGRFLNNYTIDRVMVDALWASQVSLRLHTAGQADGFFCSEITNCHFAGGGLDLTNVGDSVRVLNNTISQGITHAVYIAPVGGAAQFLGMGNNTTTRGGSFTALGASQAKWAYNQCEIPSAYVGTYNAQITLDGSISCDIIGNNINSQNFNNCVSIVNGARENVIDLNHMNVQTSTNVHFNVSGSPGNELGERNRYLNSQAPVRSATISKDAASDTRGLQSGPLTLSNSWGAGGDVTFSNGLFSTRYGRRVQLDGMISGGTTTAATVIGQLPADHWPTKSRRVPVIVDNAGVWSMGVVNINNVGQISVTVAFAGNTLVHFDGTSFEI